MRRDDREVVSIEEIFDILQRCDTIHIAMNDDGAPYIIPMTFGAELKDGKITIYFHCANEGKKLTLIEKDPMVGVECALYYQVEKTDDGAITARYESVIGSGKAEKITEREEKVASLKVMLEHYRESGFPASSCKGLPLVECYKIELDKVSGKRNMGDTKDF